MALGFTGPKLHSLRHTFGTYLISMGYDITVVREMLGHEDIKTTLVHLQNLTHGEIERRVMK